MHGKRANDNRTRRRFGGFHLKLVATKGEGSGPMAQDYTSVRMDRMHERIGGGTPTLVDENYNAQESHRLNIISMQTLEF